MKLLNYFTQYAPNLTFVAIVLGTIAGIAQTMIIPLLMHVISLPLGDMSSEVGGSVRLWGGEIYYPNFFALFISLIFVIFISRSLSQIILGTVAVKIRYNLRKEFYSEVRKASIHSLEKLGLSKLIQCINVDISSIVMGAQLLPSIVTNLITVSGLLLLLMLFNSEIFYWISLVIAFGALTHRIFIKVGTKYFSKSRNIQDTVITNFRGLVDGSKELRLSLHKQEAFTQSSILQFEKQVYENEKSGIYAFSLAANYGELLSFISLAIFTFVVSNYVYISEQDRITTIMILLYIVGPTSALLGAFSQFSRAKIHLKKYEAIKARLKPEKVNVPNLAVLEWKTLKLRGIKFSYDNSEAALKHAIGPIDLDINKGEVTFIVGNNGSGKSTISKVISQHYLDYSGKIFCDNTLIDAENIVTLREQMYSIYSDYYLFDYFIDYSKSNALQIKSQIKSYIKLFRLDSHLSFDNGKFSTLDLSDGQRKRLALIIALIEDRDMYIFDEWTAEQDPIFKEVFYSQILPELKERNKAVVVISHDDRYFDVADCLYIMDKGKIIDNTEYKAVANIS
ncbi:cyclic peptide export ABC transporter [Pseudoalteromonas rhizosphaerae]|uniref:cyclic peptide export ABC transporter n=1 Tax=Pseudoalteromonas rhizosphaerae TaxID=2518973 RepID=UPI00384C34AC